MPFQHECLKNGYLRLMIIWLVLLANNPNMICAELWTRSNPGESAGAENFDLLLLPPTLCLSVRGKKLPNCGHPAVKQKNRFRLASRNGECCRQGWDADAGWRMLRSAHTYAKHFCICILCFSYHDLLDLLYALTLFSANFDPWNNSTLWSGGCTPYGVITW